MTASRTDFSVQTQRKPNACHFYFAENFLQKSYLFWRKKWKFNYDQENYFVFVNACQTYGTYFMIQRCPAGQLINVEAAAGDAVKIGIAFYIDTG